MGKPMTSAELMFFVPAFLAGIAWVKFALPRFSGWKRLDERYRCQIDFRGEKLWFKSATMAAGSNFGGCLILGAGPDGLYIGTIFPFNLIMGPPLLVPWREIRLGPPKKSWFIEEQPFELGPDRVRFDIDRRTADQLLALAGRHAPKRPAGA